MLQLRSGDHTLTTIEVAAIALMLKWRKPRFGAVLTFLSQSAREGARRYFQMEVRLGAGSVHLILLRPGLLPRAAPPDTAPAFRNTARFPSFLPRWEGQLNAGLWAATGQRPPEQRTSMLQLRADEKQFPGRESDHSSADPGGHSARKK